MILRLLVIFFPLCLAWAQSTPLADVPITLEKNVPVAEVAVNGSPGLKFVLDSAASGCVLDATRAAELGIQANVRGLTSGSGGTQEVWLIPALQIKLGELELTAQNCYVFDMKKFKFKGQVDGVLGSPLYAKYVVELDYPALRARIYNPKAYRPSSKAQVLPMRITTGPTVRGEIMARGEKFYLDVQLDTGSAHVITICTPVVERYHLLELVDQAKPSETVGIGGASPDIIGYIDEVRIAQAFLQRPLVRLSRQTVGSFATEKNYSGNIGGEFLKQYKVTFDFAGSRVMLEQ